MASEKYYAWAPSVQEREDGEEIIVSEGYEPQWIAVGHAEWLVNHHSKIDLDGFLAGAEVLPVKVICPDGRVETFRVITTRRTEYDYHIDDD